MLEMQAALETKQKEEQRVANLKMIKDARERDLQSAL